MTTEQEIPEPEDDAVRDYVTDVATLLTPEELGELQACAQAIMEQNVVMADLATKSAAEHAADLQDEVNRRTAIGIYFALLVQGQIEQAAREDSAPAS